MMTGESQTVGFGPPRATDYALSGNDTFDVGRDSFSPVSLLYYDRAPFKFNGQIEKLTVKYQGNK